MFPLQIRIFELINNLKMVNLFQDMTRDRTNKKETNKKNESNKII